VNEYTREVNRMTYLSWTFAWKTMMENYPELCVDWHGEGAEVSPNQAYSNVTEGGTVSERNIDVFYYRGGTAMVGCTVTIEGLNRTMWLPVMSGFKNAAVTSPDTRDIGDAKMRCLVKCFAMFGLGFYLYAGEDLPMPAITEEDPVEKPAPKEVASKKADIVEHPPTGVTSASKVEFERLLKQVQALGRKLNATGIVMDDEMGQAFKKARAKKDSDALSKLLVEMESLETNQPTEGAG
jgi:hypothetical protein